MSFSSNKEKISVVGLADRMATFFATDVEGDFFDRSALVWKFGDAAGLDAREIIKEWAIVQMFLRSQVFRKHFKDTKTAESVLDYFHGHGWRQLVQRGVLVEAGDLEGELRTRYEVYYDASAQTDDLPMKLFRIAEAYFRLCRIIYDANDVAALTMFFTTLVAAEKQLAETLNKSVEVDQ